MQVIAAFPNCKVGVKNVFSTSATIMHCGQNRELCRQNCQFDARNNTNRCDLHLPPHSPRRGECWGARGGERLVEFDPVPKTGPDLTGPFLQLGDAHRQTPATQSPALPTAWGVRGSPRGARLGQFDRVAKTGPALADPIFAAGRCAPAGTRNPFPRAPHGVGSAGEPAGRPFGPV